MRDFLSFLLTSFHGWLTSVRDYIDNWLGGGGGTPTTPTGETITVGDRAGLFEAGEGNDTITSTHSASDVDFRLTGDSTIQRDDDFAEHGWWYGPMSAWNPTHAIPAVGLMPGLLVLRGGAGNDSITATGNATDAYGGTGDDIVTVHGLASVGTHAARSGAKPRAGGVPFSRRLQAPAKPSPSPRSICACCLVLGSRRPIPGRYR